MSVPTGDATKDLAETLRYMERVAKRLGLGSGRPHPHDLNVARDLLRAGLDFAREAVAQSERVIPTGATERGVDTCECGGSIDFTPTASGGVLRCSGCAVPRPVPR